MRPAEPIVPPAPPQAASAPPSQHGNKGGGHSPDQVIVRPHRRKKSWLDRLGDWLTGNTD